MFTSSHRSFKGTFLYEPKKAWEHNLNNASEDVIRETGLSREKLEEVLQILDENRIIS